MIVLDILYEKTKTIDSKVVDLVFSYACHNSSQNNIDVLNHIWVNWSDQIESIFVSVALHSHNTLKWSALLGLSFLHGAGGPGNPCYGVQAHLVNFALHFGIVSK